MQTLKTKLYLSRKFKYYNEIIELLVENFIDYIDEDGNITIPHLDTKDKDTKKEDNVTINEGGDDGLQSEHLDLFTKFRK